MSVLKPTLALLAVALTCLSCDVVYFKNPNPAKAPAAKLDAEMMGNYFFGEEDYVNLTATEADVHMTGSPQVFYTGPYGTGTKYPVYKVGNYYMLSVDYAGDDYNYYQIFLFDYNKTLGQINVRELYGGVSAEEKEKRIAKIPSSTVLKSPEATGHGDYLLDPTPKEFLKWVDNGSFTTARIFQKEKFKCQKISMHAARAATDGEYMEDLDIDEIKQDKTHPLNKFIAYYEKEKIAGYYELSLKGDDSMPQHYSIRVLCAE